VYAVKDKRNGKFLQTFSGSLNSFQWNVSWRLEKQLGRKPTYQEVHDAMFCLDAPNGAKLYKTFSAVANSFYSYHRYTRPKKTFEEALPWLEIVEVKINLV